MSVDVTESSTEELFGSAERVKLILDEDGITSNEDKINEYILEGLREVNSQLRYLCPEDTFPLTRGDFAEAPFLATDFDDLISIINELARGKFWIENNDSDTIYKTALEALIRFRTNIAEQIPATTL